MVKGVNKNIIEINDTGSEIFERIVFYISPKYGKLSAKRLNNETEKFTFNFDARSSRGYKTLRQKMKIKRRLMLITAFLGLMAAASLVWLIFFT